MCELENLVLGADGYGDVCYAQDGGGPNAPNCTAPRMSAVGLFYLQWDESVPRVDLAMAAIDDLDAAHDAVGAAVDEGASNDGTAAEAALRVAATATEAPTSSCRATRACGRAQRARRRLRRDAGAARASLQPGAEELIAAARGALDPVAHMEVETVAYAELFGGAAMRGLPHPKAPKKTNADDAIWVDGATTRDCRRLDDGYVAARARQLYGLAAVSDALRSTVGFFVAPDALERNATRTTRSILDPGRPVRAIAADCEVDDVDENMVDEGETCAEGVLTYGRDTRSSRSAVGAAL